MPRWLILHDQQYSENTPEYGMGDYPEQIGYIRHVIDADTARKAQYAAKKLEPGLRFGRFGARAMPEDDQYAHLYTKPADPRLGPNATARHNAALAKLRERYEPGKAGGERAKRRADRR